LNPAEKTGATAWKTGGSRQFTPRIQRFDGEYESGSGISPRSSQRSDKKKTDNDQ
jgi:hypothetical protein